MKASFGAGGTIVHVGWGMLWLFVALKIPIVALLWIVWWAIHQEPEVEEPPPGDGGLRVAGQREPVHPRKPLPHTPRRGPHGEQALPAPPRVRPVDARSKRAPDRTP
jgi:hypothetical protein